MKRLLAHGLMAAAAIAMPAEAAVSPPEAEAMAERMLAALGGRSAWANTKNTVNGSRQDWDGDPSELRVVITMDFERPRIRIETRGRDLHVVRVLDGDTSWRLSREGTIQPVSAETVAEDRRFYAGHVYRTLHRIAARDPRLGLPVGSQGRLEVFESGARTAWYALDRSNQPYLYGAHGDDNGAIFGPWEHEQSGIRHPAWVTREGGKWRAMLKRLEVYVRLDDAMFARPAG